MRDDEIATKRLSDWKPETDIKLQKAFGKFVEEAGELLEVIRDVVIVRCKITSPSFEDELADVLAFIDVIDRVCDGLLHVKEVDEVMTQILKGPLSPLFTVAPNVHDICVAIGRVLSIVGRCQIQGLAGSHPETGQPNIENLARQLVFLKILIIRVIRTNELDETRIEKRKQAKIDSKLPWVMGTATDLLSSI